MRLVCGIGINDFGGDMSKSPCVLKAYKAWQNMLFRCYQTDKHPINHKYKDCKVCKAWHYFTSFKEWFDLNYRDGYQIDKDLLQKGNKLYSPETCVMIPKCINIFLANKRDSKDGLPLGVSWRKKNSKFYAQIQVDGKTTTIGYYDDAIEAHKAYCVEREKHARLLADRYRFLISTRAYFALYNYKED